MAYPSIRGQHSEGTWPNRTHMLRNMYQFAVICVSSDPHMHTYTQLAYVISRVHELQANTRGVVQSESQGRLLPRIPTKTGAKTDVSREDRRMNFETRTVCLYLCMHAELCICMGKVSWARILPCIYAYPCMYACICIDTQVETIGISHVYSCTEMWTN